MLESLIDTLGLPTFVLILVGMSLLIVVILLMSYFKVLISITNFTFPNAKLRAKGNPFIKKEVLKSLVDSSNITEVLSKIQEENYELPKEETENLSSIEKKLEENVIESIKKTYMSVPTNFKPFVNIWLMKYDLKMVKRAMKAKFRGVDKEKLDERLSPVKIIDEEKLEEMKSARNMQELIAILKETQFEKPLKGKEKVDDFFDVDVELDKFLFQKIRKAVNQVEGEERSTVRYFFGNYTDVLNLKIIFRGLREEVEEEKLKESLLPSGRELEDWKLENMVESTNLDEALIELEGTSYDDLREAKSTTSYFNLEKKLDEKLLTVVSEIYSQEILTVGPLLKFLIAKEMELRNLKILIRGVKESMNPEKMSDLMVMEGPG
ncbi:MAG: V-type ATPase subunit [Candidatus Thermoplasmatota archaeon]